MEPRPNRWLYSFHANCKPNTAVMLPTTTMTLLIIGLREVSLWGGGLGEVGIGEVEDVVLPRIGLVIVKAAGLS